MKLELRFFASLREGLSLSGESIAVPAEVKTIADLRSYLIQRGNPWAQVLASSKVIRCALNQEMVADSTPLVEGSEVAFFPPVTGG
ncbi:MULTISPECIES: molybdopterin converting factor subunit 1 [unclassified Polynucleobacter]|jgi:molybdopterin synthase sulfur carrier subunit|uniref:molybdopterin converting factor subunit 1 n=1 Tax=unclassified Polynucleobacter TaxID=2640945 RepID=UPI000BD45722|nr:MULTISPECIES: molybdopterin converting factor subunit 1 [unclassified Polynucleobacter]OYY21545.1 MAG: molybdopterin converting factor subunit 1 [Polynucleobacter sp. 35-46-11]OZA78375.1 MAG: molybdopterin converting factor subunit 1 [Polynucleobacter sp. 39-46-10]